MCRTCFGRVYIKITEQLFCHALEGLVSSLASGDTQPTLTVSPPEPSLWTNMGQCMGWRTCETWTPLPIPLSLGPSPLRGSSIWAEAMSILLAVGSSCC